MKNNYLNPRNYILITSAFAQTPELPLTGQQVSLTKLTALANQVAGFLIQIAPVFAVIFLVWGGITYMAAGADEERSNRAKARIKNAIIGTIVIFGTGVILSTLSGIINRGTLQ